MGYWITSSGQYYEGDRVNLNDIAVPRRPDLTYDWNGSAWVQNAQRAAAASAQATFAAMVAAGAQVTSTSTPSLNGTYAVDMNSQSNISGIAAGIAAKNRLPGGGATFNYGDASGELHAFSQTEFLAFATAIEDFCYALYQAFASASAGQLANWPSASLSIA